MIVEIVVSLYAILLGVLAIWKMVSIQKATLTGLLSGAILLLYTTYLHATNGLAGHEYTVFVAILLLQLAPLPIERLPKYTRVIRLMIDIAIACLLLFVK